MSYKMSREQMHDAIKAALKGGELEHGALIAALERAGQAGAVQAIPHLVRQREIIATVQARGGEHPAELRYSLPEQG